MSATTSKVPYSEFLAAVINASIAAAREDYGANPGLNRERRLDGSILGLNECRMRMPYELKALLAEANERADQARNGEAEDYWFWRCRALEIEWVCNVMAAVTNQDTGVQPTARGIQMAQRIADGFK